ncbi:MAG: pseudaminic acid biosynthesis-associated methylase [Synechococcales bacterium]|nr:pseudaminic acid biosynthesis-associated methylase [Synechococcales bacterium]
MRTITEQETFWAGEFGNAYTDRNQVIPVQRQPFFAQILSQMEAVQTVCELGANRGHNLAAIAALNPQLQLTGVEINPIAWAALKQVCGESAIQTSIQDFYPQEPFDWVFTCGVLIHLNPDDLPRVYQKLYQLSNRYILINEYFNPTPVELNYRGNTGKLFKRDFAGEFLAAHGDRVRVVNYGFLWQVMHPSWDNTVWTLLEKVA